MLYFAMRTLTTPAAPPQVLARRRSFALPSASTSSSFTPSQNSSSTVLSSSSPPLGTLPPAAACASLVISASGTSSDYITYNATAGTTEILILRIECYPQSYFLNYSTGRYILRHLVLQVGLLQTTCLLIHLLGQNRLLQHVVLRKVYP